jgi:hypothetical protein
LIRISKIDRHSDFTPSPLREEQRVLTPVLRCSVEELLARLGAENAIKRVETELRRARRARSRKLHTFWSAVLIRIETETDAAEQRIPQKARGIWPRRMMMMRGRRIKGARRSRSERSLSDPRPLGASAGERPVVNVSLLLKPHHLGQALALTSFS